MEPQDTQDNNNGSQNSSIFYPPKPVVVEKQDNAIRRSLISLGIYALLFYFLFDQNVVYIAAVLLVIIIHEMGHFLMMRIFNYSNVKIFIVPLLGAFTSGKKQKISQLQLCLIILAGPVPGIILGCVLYYLNRTVQNETMSMLAYTFLIINVLNLLPFFPLDGGRLVETLFFRENYTIRLVFGIISIIALTILFLINKSLILLIIPVLIFMDIRNEHKHEKIREYLRNERINYFTDYENLSDKDYWLIRDCLIFSFPKKFGMIAPGKYEYSVFESIFIQHITAVLKVNMKTDLNFFKRMLVLIFYIVVFVAPVGLYLWMKLG